MRGVEIVRAAVLLGVMLSSPLFADIAPDGKPITDLPEARATGYVPRSPGDISFVTVAHVPYLQNPGGGAFIHATGDTSTGKNAKEGDACAQTKPGKSSNSAGDPVNFETGNLTEPETDFATAGEMGLYLRHTYNAYWDGTGIFGRYWVSNLDLKLEFTSSLATSSCYPSPGSSPSCDPTGQSIWALRPDGTKIKFSTTTTTAS